MAEQDCASLCEIGAVEAQQWQKCSFCPGFACSFNHQIFTQRLREPYVLARELRKEGEGKGFCLLLADEKEAGQGICDGGCHVTGVCHEIYDSSVMKRTPSQYVQGEAEGHGATVVLWAVWWIEWGEIVVSSRKKVQTITVKMLSRAQARGRRHVYQGPLKKHKGKKEQQTPR